MLDRTSPSTGARVRSRSGTSPPPGHSTTGSPGRQSPKQRPATPPKLHSNGAMVLQFLQREQLPGNCSRANKQLLRFARGFRGCNFLLCFGSHCRYIGELVNYIKATCPKYHQTAQLKAWVLVWSSALATCCTPQSIDPPAHRRHEIRHCHLGLEEHLQQCTLGRNIRI